MPPKRKAAAKAAAAEAGDAAAAVPEPAAAKKTKSSALAVGDNVCAIEVELQTEEEKTVTLADIVKDSGAVIFMYHKVREGCRT